MKTVRECYKIDPYHSRTFDMYFGGRSLCVFDIETTGLNPKKDKLIISGLLEICGDQATVLQFFAAGPSEEAEVVRATLDELASAEVILTYNGRSFDLPFLQTRAKRHNIPAPEVFPDLDLYQVLRYHSDLKEILGSLSQKSVEHFMGFSESRKDAIDGGISVRLYQQYQARPSVALEKTMLLHNHDDIMQLYRILPVIEKTQFHQAVASLGFPAGKGFVTACQTKKDGLHIAARHSFPSDYITFPTEDFPCHITAYSGEQSCRVFIPALHLKEGLEVIDAASLLSGQIPEELAAMPGMESGYLILSNRGRKDQATINFFVISFMTLLQSLLHRG